MKFTKEFMTQIKREMKMAGITADWERMTDEQKEALIKDFVLFQHRLMGLAFSNSIGGIR